MASTTLGGNHRQYAKEWEKHWPNENEVYWVFSCMDKGRLHKGVVDFAPSQGAYVDFEVQDGAVTKLITMCNTGCGECGCYSNGTPLDFKPRMRGPGFKEMLWPMQAGHPYGPINPRPWPSRIAPPPGPPVYSAIKLDGRTIEVAKAKFGPVRCTGKYCPDPCNPYAVPNQPDGTFKCYSCRNGITR